MFKQLSKSSFSTKLIKSSYNIDDSDLPITYTSYYFYVILAYILSIPSIMGHIINLIYDKVGDNDDEIFMPAIFSIFHIPMFLFLGILDGSKNTIIDCYLNGWLVIMAILFLISISLIIYSLFKTIIESIKEYFDDKYYRQKKNFEIQQSENITLGEEDIKQLKEPKKIIWID